VRGQTWTQFGRRCGRTLFSLDQACISGTTLAGALWRIRLKSSSSSPPPLSSVTPGNRQAAVLDASLYARSTGGAAVGPLRPRQLCNRSSRSHKMVERVGTTWVWRHRRRSSVDFGEQDIFALKKYA